MNDTSAWVAAVATVTVLVAYEMALLLLQRHQPAQLARAVHVRLREDWFTAISQQRGSEILAVQTLRNSLMSATMVASTAVLGLMGSVTLAAPSLYATFVDGEALTVHFSPRLALELILMAILLASLVCSVMAVRYYNHAGYISGMPVESQQRKVWAVTGALYLRRAGLLYSWGLRHLIMVAPILASIVYPWAGPVAACLVAMVLLAFDRFSAVQ